MFRQESGVVPFRSSGHSYCQRPRPAQSMFKQLHFLFGTKKTTARRTRVRAVHDPFLQEIWVGLRVSYFPDRTDLDDYVVTWSSRQQKRVLASCNIRRRRVVVARELNDPSAVRWISAVLYHELCHAVLGESVTTPEGRRLWHGAEFRALEARHPDIPSLNAWISSGGWAFAVRSSRSRAAWARRRGDDSPLVATLKASRRR
jgi:hypothetical protein